MPRNVPQPGAVLLDPAPSRRRRSAPPPDDSGRGMSSCSSSDSIYTPPREEDGLTSTERDRALRHGAIQTATTTTATLAVAHDQLVDRDAPQLRQARKAASHAGAPSSGTGIAPSHVSASVATAASSRASKRHRGAATATTSATTDATSRSDHKPVAGGHVTRSGGARSIASTARSTSVLGRDGVEAPDDVPASVSADSYDYYSSDRSATNSIFSDFSGRSDYGSSSLGQRRDPSGFPTLDLAELAARESHDHRSSLVTTADLEVAVVKHMLSMERVKSYLLARLEGLRQYVSMLIAQQKSRRQTPLQRVADAQAPVSAHQRQHPHGETPSDAEKLLGITHSIWLSPKAFSPSELANMERQTKAVWQLNLDGYVERYLSDPVYRTALAQFRKHQGVAQQYLRLPDYRENYRLATSLKERFRLSQTVARVLQGDADAAIAATGFCNGGMAASVTGSGGSAGGGGMARRAVYGDDSARFGFTAHSADFQGGHSTASTRDTTASSGPYGLTRADVELLGMDAARRIRFKDDTLPWRPVNFDSTTIRLEQIELSPRDSTRGTAASEPYGRHPSSPDHSVADLSAISHSGPLVGGSINLLVEVLILTELDVPFTFGVPRVNFTNVFMITASLFVLPDVLISKFIRLFRSVYYWNRYEIFSSMGDTVNGDAKRQANTQRASYLHRRILQCMLAYCRCHEMDLTVGVLQRVALFIEKCGFPSPLVALDRNTSSWVASRGVLDGQTLNRGAPPTANTAGAGSGGATTAGKDATPTSKASGGALSDLAPGDTKAFRSLALQTSKGGAASTAPSPRDATRIPMESFDDSVVYGFLELSLYIQQFTTRHYHTVAVTRSQASGHDGLGSTTTTTTPSSGLPASPAAPPSGPSSLRSGGQTTGSSPRPTGSVHRTVSMASLETLRCGSQASTTAATAAAAVGAPPRPLVYLDRGEPRRHLGSTYVTSRYTTAAAAAANQKPMSAVDSSAFSGGGYAGNSVDPQGGRRGPLALGLLSGTTVASSAPPEEFHWMLRGNVGDNGGAPGPASGKPIVERPGFRPTMLHAELFAQQLSVLSFSLFSRIRVRELLNNAWLKLDMRDSVAGHLNELIRYGQKLGLWAAAHITAPRQWDECQRSLRHFLEICRRLYDQQNYEMASALLYGLQHESVARLSTLYKEAHDEPILTPAEQRELETLTELMNPYAAYSPSSLNSVTARTAGDMDSPIIPLLSPILAVLSRAQESRRGNPAVAVREHDGQAIVIWTKVMAIGKMVNLWLRCQVTPFPYRPEPALQEYLWSLANHQWTDESLLRVARRDKH